MRVAIVSYMGYDGPGVMHAHHFANRLVAGGHEVLFLLNGDRASAELMADRPLYELAQVAFRQGALTARLRRTVEAFSPDVVHIWTPRHVPARVGIEIAVDHGARLVIHFEDDEEFILRHFGSNSRFCRDDLELFRLFVAEEPDARRLEAIADELDTDFLRLTALDPPSWAWIHPIVSAVAMRLAAATTVISEPYREYLRGMLGEGPSHLLYPGVDHERFAGGDGSGLAAELGLEGRQVLLYSGAISDIHDFTDMLQAMPRVVREHPDAVLVQVGRNDIPDLTEHIIEELDIEDHVVLTGAVPHHRMPDYLALGDVFLAPVRVDDFNAHRLPSKVPEYMAVGRPMVIVDHGFGRELEQGAEVEKVGSEAPEEVAAALHRLLSAPERWEPMGERLRAKSRELFDWSANTAGLVAFYERVLESAPADRPEGLDETDRALTLDRIGYVPRDSPAPKDSEPGGGRVRHADHPGSVPARRGGGGREGSPRVVIFTDGRVGRRMSGTGIRYWELARALSAECDVALGHRYPSDTGGDGFEVFRWDPTDPERGLDVAADADVVIVHGYVLEKVPELGNIGARLVVDLYCPFLFENMQVHRERELPLEEREAIHANDLRVLLDQLQVGDYFLCCTDRQRSWTAGMLTALNRLRPSTTDPQRRIEEVVGLVPFGLSPTPDEPPREAPVLKGVMPGVEEDDLVLLWGGGIWSWLDPETLVRAMARVGEEREDVKLVFLSTLPAEEDLVGMPIVEETLRLASELDVRDGTVVFNTEDYVEYGRRAAYFREADVGVCSHIASLESHYAFRTRVLDYLAFGLPVITSEGDHFGDLVAREDLGFAVPPGDVGGWTEAILRLADDDALRESCGERSRTVSEQYAWDRVVEPLLDYCLDPDRVGLPRAAAGARTQMRHLLAGPPPGTGGSGGESLPSDLAERSDEELFEIALHEVEALKGRLAETREHAAMTEARYRRTLETLRVMELQLNVIRKVPFTQTIWRLIKKLRYPHLTDQ